MAINKILLVDDEPDIRMIGAMSLKSVGGWETLEAENGLEAITLATQHRPDVILLDVMMPELDGPTTLQRLRETPDLAETPVIFLTAKVQRSELARYMALGALGVIHKPFDPMTLPGEVEALVTNHTLSS